MHEDRRSRRSRLGVLLLLGAGTACAPAALQARLVGYDLDVAVEPAEHRLEADAEVRFAAVEGDAPERGRVDLRLHPALEVDSVEVEGAVLRSHRARGGKIDDGAIAEPTTHRLIVERPSGPLTVTLHYAGRLEQDVDAGEVTGQIHNFAVSAHIGDEGLYLEPSGYWYPRVEHADDADPEDTLADFALAVAPPAEFELVAGAERRGTRGDGALLWASPFPLDGLVLLGGPLQRASRTHGDVELHAVLAPGKEDVAEDILDASAEYLDRYEALIGPYPFREFTVLEAFFSSGFAFPTCTQIAGSQLSRYRQYRRHGYLDHELLHNWYGNGIFVDPRDGNWCEGLSSYLGNYYGHVLDGDEEGARKQRRNQSNFLSAIGADEDRPLGTFGLEDGAGRGIGYQKAASVFHMLERTIGRDAMFAALRELTDERVGRFASWVDLQRVFEHASDRDLDAFFEQWVRRGGAPALKLRSAAIVPGEGIDVTIEQGDAAFALDVPLRLQYDDREEDVVAPVAQTTETVRVPCATDGLRAVELDPDYHLFRRLEPDELMPTWAVTNRDERLLVVLPEGELAEGYGVLLEASRDDDERTLVERRAGEVTAEELAASSVLILGDAVRAPAVEAFLARTRSPVHWNDDGFVVDGAAFESPRQALFFTVHHPDLRDAGVTVYYGNAPEALSNAAVLGFYPNSLLVFETPEGAGLESGDAMPRAAVVERRDFEFHERVEF